MQTQTSNPSEALIRDIPLPDREIIYVKESDTIATALKVLQGNKLRFCKRQTPEQFSELLQGELPARIHLIPIGELRYDETRIAATSQCLLVLLLDVLCTAEAPPSVVGRKDWTLRRISKHTYRRIPTTFEFFWLHVQDRQFCP